MSYKKGKLVAEKLLEELIPAVEFLSKFLQDNKFLKMHPKLEKVKRAEKFLKVCLRRRSMKSYRTAILYATSLVKNIVKRVPHLMAPNLFNILSYQVSTCSWRGAQKMTQKSAGSNYTTNAPVCSSQQKEELYYHKRDSERIIPASGSFSSPPISNQIFSSGSPKFYWVRGKIESDYAAGGHFSSASTYREPCSNFSRNLNQPNQKLVTNLSGLKTGKGGVESTPSYNHQSLRAKLIDEISTVHKVGFSSGGALRVLANKSNNSLHSVSSHPVVKLNNKDKSSGYQKCPENIIHKGKPPPPPNLTSNEHQGQKGGKPHNYSKRTGTCKQVPRKTEKITECNNLKPSEQSVTSRTKLEQISSKGQAINTVLDKKSAHNSFKFSSTSTRREKTKLNKLPKKTTTKPEKFLPIINVHNLCSVKSLEEITYTDLSPNLVSAYENRTQIPKVIHELLPKHLRSAFEVELDNDKSKRKAVKESDIPSSRKNNYKNVNSSKSGCATKTKCSNGNVAASKQSDIILDGTKINEIKKKHVIGPQSDEPSQSSRILRPRNQSSKTRSKQGEQKLKFSGDLEHFLPIVCTEQLVNVKSVEELTFCDLSPNIFHAYVHKLKIPKIIRDLLPDHLKYAFRVNKEIKICHADSKIVQNDKNCSYDEVIEEVVKLSSDKESFSTTGRLNNELVDKNKLSFVDTGKTPVNSSVNSETVSTRKCMEVAEQLSLSEPELSVQKNDELQPVEAITEGELKSDDDIAKKLTNGVLDILNVDPILLNKDSLVTKIKTILMESEEIKNRLLSSVLTSNLTKEIIASAGLIDRILENPSRTEKPNEHSNNRLILQVQTSEHRSKENKVESENDASAVKENPPNALQVQKTCKTWRKKSNSGSKKLTTENSNLAEEKPIHWKKKSELERLHEDIKNMYIGKDVARAYGARKCIGKTLLALHGNYKNKTNKQKMLPPVDDIVQELKKKPLDIFPESKKKTLDILPESKKKTLDILPEPKKKTLDMPEPKKKTLDIPEPKKKTLDMPEPKKKTLDMPEPKKKTLDLSEPKKNTLNILLEPKKKKLDKKIKETIVDFEHQSNIKKKKTKRGAWSHGFIKKRARTKASAGKVNDLSIQNCDSNMSRSVLINQSRKVEMIKDLKIKIFKNSETKTDKTSKDMAEDLEEPLSKEIEEEAKKKKKKRKKKKNKNNEKVSTIHNEQFNEEKSSNLPGLNEETTISFKSNEIIPFSSEDAVTKCNVIKSCQTPEESIKKVETLKEMSSDEDINKLKLQVIAETKHQLITETKHQLIAETKHQLIAETKHPLIAETKHQLLDETNDQLLAVTNDQLLAVTNDQLLAEINDQLLAVKNEQLLEVKNDQLLTGTNDQLLAETRVQLFTTKEETSTLDLEIFDTPVLEFYFRKSVESKVWKMQSRIPDLHNFYEKNIFSIENMKNKLNISVNSFGSENRNLTFFDVSDLVVKNESIEKLQGISDDILEPYDSDSIYSSDVLAKAGPFRVIHVKIGLSYLCSLNGCTFNTPDDTAIMEHLQIFHKNEKQNWSCSVCDLVCLPNFQGEDVKNDLRYALHHLTTVHNIEKARRAGCSWDSHERGLERVLSLSSISLSDITTVANEDTEDNSLSDCENSSSVDQYEGDNRLDMSDDSEQEDSLLPEQNLNINHTMETENRIESENINEAGNREKVVKRVNSEMKAETVKIEQILEVDRIQAVDEMKIVDETQKVEEMLIEEVTQALEEMQVGEETRAIEDTQKGEETQKTENRQIVVETQKGEETQQIEKRQIVGETEMEEEAQQIEMRQIVDETKKGEETQQFEKRQIVDETLKEEETQQIEKKQIVDETQKGEEILQIEKRQIVDETKQMEESEKCTVEVPQLKVVTDNSVCQKVDSCNRYENDSPDMESENNQCSGLSVTQSPPADMGNQLNLRIDSVMSLNPKYLMAMNGTMLDDIQNINPLLVTPGSVFHVPVPVVKEVTNFSELISNRTVTDLFKCMGGNCQFTTNSYKVAQAHYENHEDETAGLRENSRKWRICVYCSLELGSSADYIFHILYEHGRSIFQCAYCFYRSVACSNTFLHQKREHEIENVVVFKCPQPAVIFTPEENSNIQDILPFVCGDSLCKMKTNIVTEFVNHLETHHNPKSFACGLCKYVTYASETLVEHYEDHGLSLFQCIYCLCGSSDLEYMRLHLCTSHPSKSPNVVMRKELSESLSVVQEYSEQFGLTTGCFKTEHGDLISFSFDTDDSESKCKVLCVTPSQDSPSKDELRPKVSLLDGLVSKENVQLGSNVDPSKSSEIAIQHCNIEEGTSEQILLSDPQVVDSCKFNTNEEIQIKSEEILLSDPQLVNKLNSNGEDQSSQVNAHSASSSNSNLIEFNKSCNDHDASDSATETFRTEYDIPFESDVIPEEDQEMMFDSDCTIVSLSEDSDCAIVSITKTLESSQICSTPQKSKGKDLLVEDNLSETVRFSDFDREQSSLTVGSVLWPKKGSSSPYIIKNQSIYVDRFPVDDGGLPQKTGLIELTGKAAHSSQEMKILTRKKVKTNLRSREDKACNKNDELITGEPQIQKNRSSTKKIGLKRKFEKNQLEQMTDNSSEKKKPKLEGPFINSFVCIYCQIELRSVPVIQEHFRTDHETSKCHYNIKDSNGSDISLLDKSRICYWCSSILEDEKSLLKHHKKKHEHLFLEKVNVIKLFHCPLCVYKSEQFDSVVLHFEEDNNHGVIFLCSECDLASDQDYCKVLEHCESPGKHLPVKMCTLWKQQKNDYLKKRVTVSYFTEFEESTTLRRGRSKTKDKDKDVKEEVTKKCTRTAKASKRNTTLKVKHGVNQSVKSTANTRKEDNHKPIFIPKRSSSCGYCNIECSPDAVLHHICYDRLQFDSVTSNFGCLKGSRKYTASLPNSSTKTIKTVEKFHKEVLRDNNFSSKFMCAICKCILKSIAGLIHHFSSNHPKKEYRYQVLGVRDIGRLQEESMICYWCSVIFEAEHSLYSHNEKAHKPYDITYLKQRKKYKCPLCMFSNLNFNKVAAHIQNEKNHVIVFHCPECDFFSDHDFKKIIAHCSSPGKHKPADVIVTWKEEKNNYLMKRIKMVFTSVCQNPISGFENSGNSFIIQKVPQTARKSTYQRNKVHYHPKSALGIATPSFLRKNFLNLKVCVHRLKE